MEQTLGDRIVANRKRMHLTQEQLAEKLGITAQAVSKWENNQSCPDITMLPQLADIFGISTDALLGRTSGAPVFQAEVVEENENESNRNGIHVAIDNSRKGNITFAVFVLLVGGLLSAAKAFSWDVSFWGILWPSALLIFGLSGIFPHFSVFCLGIALFGGYSLVHNLGFWTLNIANELVFPIIIVLFGVGLLIDALRKPRASVSIHKKVDPDPKSTIHEDGESFECNVRFGETTHVVTLPRLSSGKARVSFGALTVDLRDCAEIANDCQLDCTCSFGELVLLVPSSCKVVQKTGSAFGALEFSGEPDDDAATWIHLSGSVSFGAIEVRYL